MAIESGCVMAIAPVRGASQGAMGGHRRDAAASWAMAIAGELSAPGRLMDTLSPGGGLDGEAAGIELEELLLQIGHPVALSFGGRHAHQHLARAGGVDAEALLLAGLDEGDEAATAVLARQREQRRGGAGGETEGREADQELEAEPVGRGPGELHRPTGEDTQRGRRGHGRAASTVRLWAMPTDRQRERLCQLMSRAFIEIRACGWQGNAEQAAALADACHNLPEFLYSERFDWSWARLFFEQYQELYPKPRADYVDYVAMMQAIEAAP